MKFHKTQWRDRFPTVKEAEEWKKGNYNFIEEKK